MYKLAINYIYLINGIILRCAVINITFGLNIIIYYVTVIYLACLTFSCVLNCVVDIINHNLLSVSNS